MKKYFKEEKEQELMLSEYLEKSDIKRCLCDNDIREKRTKYLINILGNVKMTEDIYILYINSFQKFGGKYSVRTRPDTLIDIYNITNKYNYLSSNAIDKIWFIYIRDLFNEYNLMNILEKFISAFGKNDEAFELFIDYVEKKADINQKKYILESSKADELKEEYSENFISHLKDLIIREHYTYEDIKNILPSSDLIKEDEEHILELSTKLRIHIGSCQPISYTMFDSLIRNKTLDMFEDKPKYSASTGLEEYATFTKEDFIKSIKEKDIRIKK